MKKPKIDFFVIGAARCGTTSLFRTLEHNPEVFVPSMKEPRFFSDNWSKGWGWYAGLYKDAPEHAKLGDFSPNYSNAISEVHRAVRVMKQSNPNPKIIYMVRNPVACAISNWRMRAEILGYELPFMEALEHEDWTVPVYHRACFFRQINFYREAYGDESILAVPLEAMKADPTTWMTKVYTHIGITPGPTMFPKANPSNSKPNRPKAPDVTIPDRIKFMEMVIDDAHAMIDFMGQSRGLWSMGPKSKAWESG